MLQWRCAPSNTQGLDSTTCGHIHIIRKQDSHESLHTRGRCAYVGDTVHCTCLAVISSDWPATTNMQALSLRAAPSCILLGHLHVGLTQTCLQGWSCAAHGTRATAWSQCVPESRGRPCATGSGKLHASVKCAVPKSGPRNGPKRGPPGGSTNSWWNRMGVQFLGSIGGPFFCP